MNSPILWRNIRTSMVLARDKVLNGRGRQQSGKFLPQAAWRSLQRFPYERGSHLRRKVQEIDIGAFRMGIVLVAWRRILRRFQQDFPGTLFVEQPLSRSFAA